ncbi:MAG: TrmJ/YjtD family RNA methyltransferase [Candidatus Heimdallarchaeota archaeon]|nr:MAG: TrmJ/YjtD family RNA methyltransferase [Candidatus Heimdallarchaeota archaeon]
MNDAIQFERNDNNLWNNISIILVEPSKPQNLGSIARVMMNLGFYNLVIVNPRLNLADPEIEIVSRRANTIINRAHLVSDLIGLRERFDFLIGTTSRSGSDYNLRRVAIPPERLLEEKLEANKLAIVFGREQHGLTNAEIELCDLVVTIPTHPSYPVLNISHAATITLYFLSRRFRTISRDDQEEKPKHRVASYKERQQLLNYFERLIHTSGYHPEKRHVASQVFSNIISRGYVTGRELTTLMGVLKWVELNLQS